jgi:hypothetical protein
MKPAGVYKKKKIERVKRKIKHVDIPNKTEIRK